MASAFFMGREKSRMMEADERGWYEPDGYVCPDCVKDDFLKEVIHFMLNFN